jgi:large subunit ribosomal protein L15
MANELSNLKPPKGSRRKPFRKGRGEGSGLGKTAGRGTKGQRARGSVAIGFEGGQMPLDRRLPKRGFVNVFATRYTEVRLDHIAARCKDGDVVDAAALKALGVIRKIERDGIKVLGNGEIGFKLTVRANKFTASAQSKIEAAGGVAELVGAATPSA